MNQHEFDFNKDINEPTYTAEDNSIINEIVSDYQTKKNTINDEAIILNLFFEEYFIEIAKRLKTNGYFDGDWNLEASGLAIEIYKYILHKTTLCNSTVLEIITLSLRNLSKNIKIEDFQNNSQLKFSFDRKITKEILEKIECRDIEKAVCLYIIYLKIWNHCEIYVKPFNNPKAQLIYHILASDIWPRKNISYEVFDDFIESVNKILIFISNKNMYLPFFDTEERPFYIDLYLRNRNTLKENIEKLWEHDTIDENENYQHLIKDLIDNPVEKGYKKKIIILKVNNSMMPDEADKKMFMKLYESSSESDFGKWLISRFYLYELIF